MTLGQNIITLRKKLKLSQNDLGKAVGTSGDIIGRYERDEVKPSIEVAIKIADALQVSLDYLVGKTSLEVDQNTLKRIEEIGNLSKSAKEQIYLVIDALIRDYKAKKAYS
ncbi:helix-turn-helix domain-containing protein [Chryseobacterium balustinum]|uniref:DNA-binding transcriptional regulator, XRE-family HTH domain n=1 Tax=Chryseobacterium balustinum TaxID=246 RepID=A0ABY1LFP1_9FLAO|nr:helix-turn-helix transcriptional regulator [Chryseobacterium balustinum]AZB30323.1 XRE family transcriptional regulator [Chryseobacterium balustinum]AZB30331.1 XRE family transcriptional regulator [Chryseobacterium balustinum]SKC14312.1 DNA-binding transcriptional regulator, XRE-family HTH domain [Chryseobacterium balustinum]